MENQVYITEIERERCQKVADAFAELCELDIIVKDTGKYGFVKLSCYDPEDGFNKITTFTDSKELFDDLWEEWWKEQVFAQALGTPLIALDYEEIFQALPREKQEEIMAGKNCFNFYISQ